MRESGQIIIILLLMLLVALSIGLTITQRTITDVTTSTQNETASRAFSAAEAGLEQAVQDQLSGTIQLGNNSSVTVEPPRILPVGGVALEYPPVGKETIAQFWLADPASPTFTPAYRGESLYFYFGNENLSITSPDSELPAVELTVIVSENGTYKSYKYFFDSKPNRSSNNFNNASCGGLIQTNGVVTSSSEASKFYCRVRLPDDCSPGCQAYPGTGISVPVLVRARILYSDINQKIALGPTGGTFPPQAQSYTATGVSGESVKKIQLFRMKNVVLPFFDFAIFSAGNIEK